MPAARRAAALVLAAVAAVPLAGAAWCAVRAGLDAGAWAALADEPQLPTAIGLALGTGLVATLLSIGAAALVLSQVFATTGWRRLARVLAPMLAVPHAGFAIGLAFLIAPSGWLLRLVSPWATGFELPPAWATTQDPWGMALVLALVGKEVPFLLWAAFTQLERPDVAARWRAELVIARTLGYGRRKAWWRVVWPQLAPRLAAPVLAVFAYSATVVDVALVIGPTSPPTAAVLAWQWLLDGDPGVNARGAALAWLLALAVAGLAALGWLLHRHTRPRRRWTRGDRGADGGAAGLTRHAGRATLVALAGVYAATALVLAVASVAGVWTFPALWPQQWSDSGWRSVTASTDTLGHTATLALASAACALVWAVAWLELAPPAWDRRLRRLLYLPLLLPSVVWVLGLHALALRWGLDGRWGGLFLAHTLAAAPYVVIALSPAYLAFDPRARALAATLGHGGLSFLLCIKWPLLRAALAAAFAVGFAVSVAQYLPTLFVGAGRFQTVTTEAVTLASGGQRVLLAAFAGLQWLLPALAFALAAAIGRPRRFTGGGR